MVALKKFNIDGQELGEVVVGEALVGFEANSQLVKDYIVALRRNARQWSANTLGRSEVKHTTKKPHKQKGTGRARQGMTVAPQYKGGGIVHGPKPKFDQHIRINRKERKQAILHFIAEMVREGRVSLVDGMEMDAPKTQTVSKFLKARNFLGSRILFLKEGSYRDENKVQSARCSNSNFVKSMRNIPKVDFSLAKNTNAYDLAKAKELILTEAALEELVSWLITEKKKG